MSIKKLRLGIIDTGINPWHSHVRGEVSGCRIYLNKHQEICEDSDYNDPLGHGTAIAGILRKTLPEADLFAVRVFDKELSTYPSLVARGILRAAAEGCDVINLSLALPPGVGAALIAEACVAAQKAGSILVAAGDLEQEDLLPASLPGVYGVIADDSLEDQQIKMFRDQIYPWRARGLPRELEAISAEINLSGHSLACARVTAHVAAGMQDPEQDRTAISSLNSGF